MLRSTPLIVTLLASLALAAGKPAPAATLPAAPGYSLTDLGSLGGGMTVPIAINVAGAVAGSSATATGEIHAFLLPPGGPMQDLGAMGGTASYATSLNNRGDVAGYINTTAGLTHAFAIIDGQMTDLGLAAGVASKAVGINDLGQVPVVTRDSQGNASSLVWQDGKMTALGTLGGSSTLGGAINNLGQVVGSATTTGGETHAFVSDPTTHQLTDLGNLGPGGVMTHANEVEQAVGIEINGIGARVAFDLNLTMPGSLAEEIVYPGFNATDAYWVNNEGTFLGAGELPAAPGSNATRWNPPDYDFTNLNPALAAGSGWTLLSAKAINDGGEIVGTAGPLTGPPIAYMLAVLGPELSAEKAAAMATSLGPAIAAVQKGSDAAAKAAAPSVLATALTDLQQAQALLTPEAGQTSISGVSTGRLPHLLNSAGNLLLAVPGNSPFLSPADRDAAAAIIAAEQKSFQ